MDQCPNLSSLAATSNTSPPTNSFPSDPTPPDYMVDFLNLASTQAALGVDTNYTSYSNNEIYYAFQQTGDFVYPNFKEDLEAILNASVRVSMIYGGAYFLKPESGDSFLLFLVASNMGCY